VQHDATMHKAKVDNFIVYSISFET
jgi:hypothetical protein